MRFTALAAAAAFLAAAPLAAAPPSPEDRAALEALAARNDASWSAGDAAAVAADYSEDGNIRLAGMAAPIAGRAAVRSFFEGNFARREGTLRHITQLESIDLVAPGIALADAHVRVEQLRHGRWELVRSFANHSVVRREAGGWRLHAVRAHRLP